MAHRIDHITERLSDLWQRPAKTEEWAFEQVQHYRINSEFFEYVPFPWATLIDLENRNKPVGTLEAYLRELGPRKTLIRATTCQHIWVEKAIPQFKRLGITDVFWPHALEQKKEIEGIRFHPFPLFPVCCFDQSLDAKTEQRDLLFSFVGAYDPQLYLAPTRQWIFDLPDHPDYVIIKRTEWHFEQQTYRSLEQNDGHSSHSHSALQAASDMFKTLLLRSTFALCPSGSGPNSIRLWEALGLGAIPVLLADGLSLPGRKDEWESAIIRLNETPEDIRRIPETLRKIMRDSQQIKERRNACRNLWEKYVEAAGLQLIKPLSNMAHIGSILRADGSP